jgi:hypothetical protein
MRMGKSVGEAFPLLSNPEVKVTMVPLTEAEHYQCIEVITGMDAPDSIVGAAIRDRRNANEILWRAIRNPENLQEYAFDTVDEMMDLLEVTDVNHLMDCYFEMCEEVSPTLGSFSDEDLEATKKVLEEMDLSALSGRQWYALKRFLSTVGWTLLPDNSPGSTSTNLLTTMSDAIESIPGV